MKESEFKDWLETKLKETPSNHYEPNGNSARAIVTRGRWKEIVYQYKLYPKSVIYEIKSFKGYDTPIIYFINLIVILLFSSIIPSIWGYSSYNRALEEFKLIFKITKDKG